MATAIPHDEVHTWIAKVRPALERMMDQSRVAEETRRRIGNDLLHDLVKMFISSVITLTLVGLTYVVAHKGGVM